MKYELYKKVYALKNYQKSYILENFDNIVEILNDVKEKPHTENVIRKSPSVYPEKDKDGSKDMVQVANIKTASGTHDPETIEELKKLIEVFEKHISSNRDLSNDTISIFLNPLHRGVKKYVLRPYKLVGMVRNLEKLSRLYQRNKNVKRESALYQIEREFKQTLNNIKTKVNEYKPMEKNAQLNSYDSSAVVENAVNLITNFDWSKEDVLNLVMSSNLSIQQDPKPFLEALETALKNKGDFSSEENSTIN